MSLPPGKRASVFGHIVPIHISSQLLLEGMMMPRTVVFAVHRRQEASSHLFARCLFFCVWDLIGAC